MHPRSALSLSVLSLSIWLVACPKPPCGPGTREEGGQCVPVPVDAGQVLTCGPGTREENGQCVPVTSPGGGGTDGGTGDAGTGGGLSCGPGTHQEGSQCLPGSPIDTLELAPASTTARVGVPVLFNAVAKYQGSVVDGVSYTWTTQDTAIATIDANGTATGKAVGTTQVRASARGVTSAPAQLTIEPGPAFVLGSVSPTSASGGASVVLTGSRFGLTQGSTQVRFGSTVATTVLSWSDTRIVVRVPFGMVPGRADVTLADAGFSSDAVAFTVLTTPYVLSVAPAQAVRGSKVTLALSGSNLGSCAVAVHHQGSVDAAISVDNTSKVIERSGAPGLPDLLRVNADVGTTASLGERAVSCGSSTTAVTEDNRFTVTVQAGTISAQVGTGTDGLGGDGGQAMLAKLSEPSALAVGRSGELYIADTGNHRVRVANPTEGPLTVAGVELAAGAIMTLAGGGGDGSSRDPGLEGNGGPAALSRLNAPGALAYDARGLLFIADTGNHCVRVVNVGTAAVTLAGGSVPPGRIELVAGACGLAGYFGDGAWARQDSRFNGPMGVAVDGQGLLYVADTGNHRLRVVNTSTGTVTNGLGTLPSGHVMLVAGSSSGLEGDGAQAGSATKLNAPTHLALGWEGLLFIADTGNNKVRVLNPLSVARTFGGPPPAAGLGTVLPSGHITTAVGKGGAAGFSGDGWSSANDSTPYPGGGAYTFNAPNAPRASLASPSGLATGPLGELFLADRNNNRVRLALMGDSPLHRGGKWFYPAGIDTVVGDGLSGSTSGAGDQGPATSANVFGPLGVAHDAERGLLYVADTLHHRVRRVQLELPRDPFSGELGAWPSDFTSGAATLDVDTGILSYSVAGGAVERRFGVTGGVFSFSGRLRIYPGTTLDIVGTRPAVLAATGDVEVDGTVRVNNGGMPNGPGFMHYAGIGHGVRGSTGNQCNTYYMVYYGGNTYGNEGLRPVTPGTGPNGTIGGALVLSAGRPGTSAKLKVAGAVQANSGPTGACASPSGGSGGGLRLVATGEVSVTGTLTASPGSAANSVGGYLCCSYSVVPVQSGAEGRIRLEAPSVTATGTSTPAASILSAPPVGLPWL